jgi:hypothetical protein
MIAICRARFCLGLDPFLLVLHRKVHNFGSFAQCDSPIRMPLIQDHQIQRRKCNKHNKNDEETQIRDQSTQVARLLGGRVEMGSNDVSSALADEERCGCALSFRVASGVLRGP